MSTTIHQEISLPATAQRVYEALIDQTQHSAFTGGAPTEISRDAGGAFSCHGGRILGRNLELVPGQRIVQAWRAASWAEGLYSVVHIQLVDEGKKTKLTLDHTGVPEGQSEHLEAGWHKMYWEPLQKYLG